MFDSTCKFLAENFSEDFASWLLGKSISFTTLSPSELSLEPIRADALILLDSEDIIVHLEFQTDPDPAIPFRMLDYRTRVYRRFPKKQMRQVVIYLTPSRSDLVHQTTFELSTTRHEFEVVRLWEQPTQSFLDAPGLLPFAVLSSAPDKLQTLRQVATRIDEIQDAKAQSNLCAAAGILAGLSLEKGLVNRVLRKDLMQQSSIYQEILQEGEYKEARSLVLRQLKRRLGTFPSEMEDRVQSLGLTQLELLGEALLDFSQLSDLSDWLQHNT
ncbi:MAG TPA: Rpn family recombination-promoting nuclease/putative transposase [Stenomitos sp.]